MKSKNSRVFNLIFFATVLFVTVAGIAGADDKAPSTKALTKDEHQQVLRVAQEYQAAANAFNQAADAVLVVSLDDCAKVVATLANQRIAFERLKAAQSRRDDLLISLNKIHDCEGCSFATDGKSLVRPIARD